MIIVMPVHNVSLGVIWVPSAETEKILHQLNIFKGAVKEKHHAHHTFLGEIAMSLGLVLILIHITTSS